MPTPPHNPPHPSARIILAAGGILWRTPHRAALAVIHRARHDDWTLPKGKAEPGESLGDCALREVLEETACRAALGPFADLVRYHVRDTPKFVFFWHMTVLEEGAFQPAEEVAQLAWLSPHDARRQLTYDRERALIPDP